LKERKKEAQANRRRKYSNDAAQQGRTESFGPTDPSSTPWEIPIPSIWGVWICSGTAQYPILS